MHVLWLRDMHPWIVLTSIMVHWASITAMPQRGAVRPRRSDMLPNSDVSHIVGHNAIKTMAVEGVNPEVHMDVTELITSHGYPCENHWVTTEDGYILNIQRIPHGRDNKDNKNKRPVALLQHGLFTSSSIFLLNAANSSLGFLLADAGVDVWLANSRGNIYSTNHTVLDTKEISFWDFSWDEMARYDLPAMLDFIVTKTGQERVHLVGYSQGTTVGFAAFSHNPDLVNKVKLFTALAPVARVGNVTSVLRSLVPYTPQLKALFNTLGHGAVDLSPGLSRYVAGHWGRQWDKHLCEKLVYQLFGFNPRSFNLSRFDVYMAQMPAGTSVRNLLHWAQAAMSRRFQQFDWGTPKANLEKYGQAMPPQYDLRRVNVPVAIFRGGHDSLADPADVNWLLPQLPHVTRDVSVDAFNHLDFVTGTDAPDQIYKPLIALMRNY